MESSGNLREHEVKQDGHWKVDKNSKPQIVENLVENAKKGLDASEVIESIELERLSVEQRNKQLADLSSRLRTMSRKSRGDSASGSKSSRRESLGSGVSSHRRQKRGSADATPIIFGSGSQVHKFVTLDEKLKEMKDKKSEPVTTETVSSHENLRTSEPAKPFASLRSEILSPTVHFGIQTQESGKKSLNNSNHGGSMTKRIVPSSATGSKNTNRIGSEERKVKEFATLEQVMKKQECISTTVKEANEQLSNKLHMIIQSRPVLQAKAKTSEAVDNKLKSPMIDGLNTISSFLSKQNSATGAKLSTGGNGSQKGSNNNSRTLSDEGESDNKAKKPATSTAGTKGSVKSPDPPRPPPGVNSSQKSQKMLKPPVGPQARLKKALSKEHIEVQTAVSLAKQVQGTLAQPSNSPQHRFVKQPSSGDVQSSLQNCLEKLVTKFPAADKNKAPDSPPPKPKENGFSKITKIEISPIKIEDSQSFFMNNRQIQPPPDLSMGDLSGILDKTHLTTSALSTQRESQEILKEL